MISTTSKKVSKTFFSEHEHANSMSSNNEQILEQPASSNTSPVEPVGGNAQPVHEMPGESALQEAAFGNEDLTASGNNTTISDGGVSQDLACNSAAPDEPKVCVTKIPVNSSKAKANYDLSSPQSFDS